MFFPRKYSLNIQASQKSQTRDTAVTVTFLISHRADKEQVSKNGASTVADERNAVRIATKISDVLSQPKQRRYLIQQPEIARRIVPDPGSQETCNQVFTVERITYNHFP